MTKETDKEAMRGMLVAVDFDGTCVTHEYPDVGREIGAAMVTRRETLCGLGQSGIKIVSF
jgi:hypothetical protein